MKNTPKRKHWTLLLLSILLTGMISCGSDDGSNDTPETAEHAETKQKLIGEWRLISSTVEGQAIASEDFSYLKESKAAFDDDNTYELVYKKRNGNSSSTSIVAGTYSVDGINSVTFFNSTSKIEFIDDALQITSITDDGKTQVDTFIRSDNALFNDDQDNGDIIGDDDDDNSNPPDPSFDGSAIISQIQGVWEITNVTDECQVKNTLEFVDSEKVIFTQHKKTFNRNDLLNYNVSVSFPLQSDFSGVVTKGFNTVTFNSTADCQFIKESNLSYLVQDAETIIIKEASKLTFKIVNDTTINLIFKYEDENSNEQVLQFVYTKV